MAFHTEKNAEGKDDIVIDGFTNGIQPSPHQGIADIKNLNINSLTGEASVNFNRLNTLPVILDTTNNVSGTASAPSIAYQYGTNAKLIVGSCIVPTSSTITSFTANKPYWVTAINSDNGTFQFVSITDRYGKTAITPGTTGSATIHTYVTHQFVQGATEYDQANNAYIYYICDTSGSVWVNNPNVYGVFSPAGDANGIAVVSNVTGFGITQGYAFIFSGDGIYANSTLSIQVFIRDTTVNQGWTKYQLLKTPASNTIASHYVLKVPDQNGSLYYCDSQYIGQIAGLSEQFSLMKVTTAGSTTITIPSYLQGVVPINGLPISVIAIAGGSIPAELNADAQYCIKSSTYNQGAGTFNIATLASDGTQGSAISVSAGSFYVTSFDPHRVQMTETTLEALALPYDDLTTCLGQFSQGNGLSLAIGTLGSNLYFWTPSTSAPFAVLPLPENGTHRLLNVDNTIYAFAGNKGNIYIANGSQLAGALTVPDYVANPFGTNQNPWFVWGDAMFLRGRVWFSIQDQNAGNTTGNCGGIWSFTPTQNLFLGQDQGVQLHLEHQNSYGTYNGVCDVLLPSQNQKANGSQYWSAWSSAYTGATFGIDFSGTAPYNTAQFGQIDTDLIPVGTYLAPYTPSNVEYKLSRPLVAGETIEILGRGDLTSAFTSFGTDTTATNTAFPFPTVLQGLQWLQFRVKLTSTASSPSYLPIVELRLRP